MGFEGGNLLQSAVDCGWCRIIKDLGSRPIMNSVGGGRSRKRVLEILTLVEICPVFCTVPRWALPKIGILSERMEIAMYLPRPYDLGSVPGYFQQLLSIIS